jgi:hypothetical protein
MVKLQLSQVARKQIKAGKPKKRKWGQNAPSIKLFCGFIFNNFHGCGNHSGNI